MKKNLQSLGLILLMLIAGGSVKVSAEIIVFEWTVKADVQKTISLVTNSADATIKVDWEYDGKSADPQEGPTTNTYDTQGTYKVYVSVADANIVELNCSGQGINTIYLGSMTGLKKLDLSNNNLSQPMDLSENKALEYLDYSNNGLTTPMDLVTNTALTYLDLSGNELKEPISLKANTALTYLDLSDNKLGESEAKGVLDLTLNTNLEVLNLSNNGLDDDRIPKLNANTALKVLNLSDNSFVSPADLSGNTSLEELDYSGNKALTGLSVTGLGSLEKLNVSGNEALTNLVLDNCTSLTSLNIDGTSALETISTTGMSDNQITDFSGTGTGLTGDALADLKNKVYTVTNYYTIALSIAEGVDVVDYTTGNLQVAEGEYLYLQFLPETAGGEVVLTIDGQEVEYKKNATGYSSYILNPIEKDYTISLNLKAYSVTFPTVEGITFEGAASAEYGQPYTFRMILAEGIDPENIDVYVNDEMVEPDPLRATTYTVTIDKVTGPIVVRVENQTVGIEQISVGRVYSQYGTLVVETTSAQAVQVYNVTGRQQFARTINGSAAIALTPGIYIVRVGSEVQKIVVR